MKLIINVCYGGFGIKKDVLKSLNYDTSIYSMRHNNDMRRDPRIIEMLENGEDISEDYSKLVVVTLPDNCTDYYIEEYDGIELVLYVVDGKIHFAD